MAFLISCSRPKHRWPLYLKLSDNMHHGTFSNRARKLKILENWSAFTGESHKPLRRR
jgi:hypothetical protein